MLLPCMPSKEPSWPDGEEDPEGAGSPGTSAAHLCSQLCTAICLFSRTALIWTNNTASFCGYTDHTFVWKANSGCDLVQGDGKWRECGSEFGLAENGKSLGIQVFGGAGSKKIYMYCLLLSETRITSNSRVCKAGDWLSYLMLFKICCFPLSLACFCFYRNALTRHCSNFPNRYDSPSLGALEGAHREFAQGGSVPCTTNSVKVLN